MLSRLSLFARNFLIRFQRVNQRLVFFFCAYSYSQTVAAKLYCIPVAYDNSFADEVIIDAVGISHFCKQKVGVAFVHFFDNGQLV